MPQVLDAVIGHNDTLFRRAQLKALVSIHSQEVVSLYDLTWRIQNRKRTDITL